MDSVPGMHLRYSLEHRYNRSNHSTHIDNRIDAGLSATPCSNLYDRKSHTSAETDCSSHLRDLQPITNSNSDKLVTFSLVSSKANLPSLSGLYPDKSDSGAEIFVPPNSDTTLPLSCTTLDEDQTIWTQNSTHIKITNVKPMNKKNKNKKKKKNKPRVCKVCFRSLSCASNLRRHMRIHTGDHRYICKFCQTAFPDSSNHKKHEKECGQSNSLLSLSHAATARRAGPTRGIFGNQWFQYPNFNDFSKSQISSIRSAASYKKSPHKRSRHESCDGECFSQENTTTFSASTAAPPAESRTGKPQSNLNILNHASPPFQAQDLYEDRSKWPYGSRSYISSMSFNKEQHSLDSQLACNFLESSKLELCQPSAPSHTCNSSETCMFSSLPSSLSSSSSMPSPWSIYGHGTMRHVYSLQQQNDHSLSEPSRAWTSTEKQGIHLRPVTPFFPDDHSLLVSHAPPEVENQSLTNIDENIQQTIGCDFVCSAGA